MIEIVSIAFSLSLIANGVLSLLLDGNKKDIFNLQKTNNRLVEENKFLSDKNSALLEEVKQISSISEEQKNKIREIIEKIEVHEYAVDSKVSWIDKTGEIEYGIVIDDSKIDGKTYVHLRRINKKGKIVGGIISVPSNKLKLEN